MGRMTHRSAMRFLPGGTQSRGFSLVELVTSIVILGILSAVIAPKFFSDHSVFNERGYADEVAAALRYAESVAVGSGCDVSVTLTATTYQAMLRTSIANVCVPAGSFDTPVMRVDGGTLSGTSPANVTLTSATQIVFGKQGQVNGATPPLLHIGAFAISIDPVSGLVQVQ